MGSDDDEGLIGLVMIVRDEAHGIARTLASLRGGVDHWTILDTGSRDGTQDVVRRELRGLPGELHEEPFVDFASSRNRALDLHGTARTTFTLMPDSDDYLVGAPEALRAFLLSRRDAEGPRDEAYLLPIRRGSLAYCLPLLLRARARWRYRGRVHEYVGRDGAPPADVRVPDVELRQDRVPRSEEASRARWSRDLELLRADLAADPTSSRAAFYLAQTHECLGQHAEAVLAYERRIAMGGWADETSEAMLRRARAMAASGRPWVDVQQAYLDAHAFDPRRAEPLFALAAHYYDQQQHPLSYLFASAAALLPRPPTTLFLDADVYDWKAADTAAISAFYLAEETGSASVRDAGMRFARQAVRAQPLDARLRANLSFYARRAADTFGSFAPRRIDFSTEEPYAPLNPSVHFDGARWRCLVRAVNYRLGDGKYRGPGGEPILTRNFMLELTPELDTARVVEMTDRDPTPRSDFPVHGFEDCRLFTASGRLWATCTVCDFTRSGAREVALLTIDPDDYGIAVARPLRGPWSGHHQKNWMPVAEGGALRIVYSAYPEVVLDAGTLSVDRAPSVVVSSKRAPSFEPGMLRGGSQGVWTDAGWLFVVHTVDVAGEARIYLHRFVLMSAELRVTAMSEPFCFVHRGVEFCAGLALEGERLVASFGVEDREVWLGVFRIGDVLARLSPDFEVL